MAQSIHLPWMKLAKRISEINSVLNMGIVPSCIFPSWGTYPRECFPHLGYSKFQLDQINSSTGLILLSVGFNPNDNKYSHFRVAVGDDWARNYNYSLYAYLGLTYQGVPLENRKIPERLAIKISNMAVSINIKFAHAQTACKGMDANLLVGYLNVVCQSCKEIGKMLYYL